MAPHQNINPLQGRKATHIDQNIRVAIQTQPRPHSVTIHGFKAHQVDAARNHVNPRRIRLIVLDQMVPLPLGRHNHGVHTLRQAAFGCDAPKGFVFTGSRIVFDGTQGVERGDVGAVPMSGRH